MFTLAFFVKLKTSKQLNDHKRELVKYLMIYLYVGI